MLQIKNFIDSVSLMDNRQRRELILSSEDARALRDEISKIMAELLELRTTSSIDQTIEVDLSGGKW